VRKLAREAVIFCLLGSVLTIIGSFAVKEWGNSNAADVAATRAVHAVQNLPSGYNLVDPISHDVKNTVKVPLTNGTMLFVMQCSDADRPVHVLGVFDRVYEQEHNCRNLGVNFHLTGLHLGDPEQVAIEKDYWAAYKTAMREKVPGNLMVSGLIALLYGFPAGFCVWCLYRLVRFAIFG